MTSDTSEKGLESLIVAAMAGSAQRESVPGTGARVKQATALYRGAGWILGDWHDYNREYAVFMLTYDQPPAGNTV
jgi:type I restriction enzyme, R subunit